MIVYTPPSNIAQRNFNDISVFLAGSIDMGQAINWQEDLITKLKAIPELNSVNIFNPRREDWDSTWKQEFENPAFYQQVTWELNALDAADYIIVYFAENSQAPVTMLEFGLYAQSGKIVVCCPKGFWRKGNIDIVCQKYNIPMFDTLDQIINHLFSRHTHKGNPF